MDPRAKFAAAVLRVTAAEKGWAPYFGPILSGLVRVEAREIPTMAVSADGVLYWNPSYVDRQTTEHTAMDLMHEALHVMLKHHERAAKIHDCDHELANIAQDASLNAELRKMHTPGGAIQLPDDFVVPETLNQPDGWIWERRYEELKKQPKRKVGGVGSGKCGSCSGGGKASPDGRSEAEMERIRKQVAAAIRSRAAGSVPESLKRWAEEFLAPPKVDWRTKLGQIVRAAIAHRPGVGIPTWRKMSRRQGGLGYGPGAPRMPGSHSSVPRAFVGVDTSGSMSEKELAAALVELRGILQAAGSSVILCVCDAAVHTVRPVKSVQEAAAAMVGGGGTDFAPIIEAATKHVPPIDVAIVLTDGCGPAPSLPPPMPVVWCLINGTVSPAPWGETVIVEKEP